MFALGCFAEIPYACMLRHSRLVSFLSLSDLRIPDSPKPPNQKTLKRIIKRLDTNFFRFPVVTSTSPWFHPHPHPYPNPHLHPRPCPRPRPCLRFCSHSRHFPLVPFLFPFLYSSIPKPPNPNPRPRSSPPKRGRFGPCNSQWAEPIRPIKPSLSPTALGI
jgi:hypothetical protein